MRIENTYQSGEDQQGQQLQPAQVVSERDASPLENGENTKHFFQAIMNLEYSASLVVVVNLVLIVLYSELQFSGLDTSKYEPMLTINLYFCTACALLSIFYSFCRMNKTIELKKEQKSLSQNQNILTTNYFWYFGVQSFLLLLQPHPFLRGLELHIEGTYSGKPYTFAINQLMSMLGLIRCYIPIRVALHRTIYMSPRSQRLCKLHGCSADYEYALKCMFKDSPAKLIVGFFSLSILVFALAIQICERPVIRENPLFRMDLEQFSNALWFTMVTMTTVGFGDYYPTTPFGRLIILFVVVWGIFIVSIMVVVVSNTLQMGKTEKKALIVLNRLEVSSALRQAAARFIKFTIMARRRKKQKLRTQHKIEQIQTTKTTTAEEEQELKTIYKLKDEFKALNSQLKNLYDSDDTYTQMFHKFQELNEDIRILNNNQEELINYIHNNLQYAND